MLGGQPGKVAKYDRYSESKRKSVVLASHDNANILQS